MKRGFTLVEAVICLVAISFILITLVHYNNSLSLSLANTAQKTEAFLVEYQDVANMRVSETVPVAIWTAGLSRQCGPRRRGNEPGRLWLAA